MYQYDIAQKSQDRSVELPHSFVIHIKIRVRKPFIIYIKKKKNEWITNVFLK